MSTAPTSPTVGTPYPGAARQPTVPSDPAPAPTLGQSGRMAGHATLVDRLRGVVGAQAVVDPDVVATYTTDWTGRFDGVDAGRGAARARPRRWPGWSRVCRELGVALVPQGGNTGLVGGGVPLRGEVVLSLAAPAARSAGRRARRSGHGRRRGRAGEVHHAADGRRLGLRGRPGQPRTRRRWGARWPPTPVGSTSCATATPGPSSSEWRPCSAPVRSCPISAAWSRTTPGTTWPALLCGSEGTLAVVTAARLRLVPPLPTGRWPSWPSRPSADAVEAAASLRRSLPVLEACELFLAPGLELVCSVTGCTDALRHVPPGLSARRGGRPDDDPTGCAGRGHRLDAPTGATPSWPPSRPAGPSCGVTARRTPRPSTPWGHPTSST